jgi:hypothetical protein
MSERSERIGWRSALSLMAAAERGVIKISEATV